MNHEQNQSSPLPDFYIGIITGQRDHDWITAESTYAHAKGKEVILIRGPGVTFNPTLLGQDREQLRYDEVIEQSFIGLLQQLRSSRVLGIF